MRCCIKNCFNDDSKKTNKSQGLTFHKLPRAPEHSAAWLQAITRLGCRMNKCLVVCSEHFLPEDFDDTRHNQRRVKSGVVPTIKAPVIQEDFKFCRICLSLNVKVYHMKDDKLSEMFQNVTGLLDMDNKGKILQRVCWECAARLKAAAAFREKALFSDTLLKDLELINKSDITTFQDNHTFLKSHLTIHTAFTCDVKPNITNTSSENKKVNIYLPDQPDVKDKTEIGLSQDENENEEPWIYAPIKIESEFDPIADNDDEQDRKLFADSLTTPKEDIEISDIKVEIFDDVNNLKENANYNVSIINSDESIVLANDEVHKLSVNVTMITEEDNSSVEDSQSTTEDCVSKSKKHKVVVAKEKGSMRKYRINDRLKEKIISMKNNGCPVSAIAKETGLTISSIICWWRRYRKNGSTFRRTVTPGKNQSDTQNQNNVEPGKELGPCSQVVRQRLHDAGFEHTLMKKPGNMESEGKKTSGRRVLHDDLRRRIITLKQEGVATRKIAHLLNTSRNTVMKWWDRWCKEGHMQNHKQQGRKRKTTPQEDELILQRVMQEQSVHTPSLAMEFGLSPESLRKRLKEAGFKRKIREAYAPLKAGRSQKVDVKLKQQILSMKSNGVSVTDIANQFRVPRTTIYQWWQRFCKENNVKGASDNQTGTAIEKQGSTIHDKVENSLQTPAIISSQKSLWQKLPENTTKQE